MDTVDRERLDLLFKALADSTRRDILAGLAERGGQSLFEICVRLVNKRSVSISRQAVSKHLAVLEEAGLVSASWSGRTKLHSARLPDALKPALEWLEQCVEKGMETL